MRLSRLAILAALVYALVWFLILPPMAKMQEAVEDPQGPATVMDRDFEISPEDFIVEDEAEDPESLVKGEERIRIGAEDTRPRIPPTTDGSPGPRENRDPRDARAQRASRAGNGGSALPPGGLPLGTFELTISDAVEGEGPRPRVQMKPAFEDPRILKRLENWTQTAGIPRLDSLFDKTGMAVNSEGKLTMRLPASMPWVLEYGPGADAPRGQVSLKPLEPGEVRAQTVALADIVPEKKGPRARGGKERAGGGQTKTAAAGEGGRRAERGEARADRGDARANRGTRRRGGKAALPADVAMLEITAMDREGAKRSRGLWVRLSPDFGRAELTAQILAWAQDREGAIPEIFGEGHVHKLRGPLRVAVPPGVPFEAAFGQEGAPPAKLKIQPLLGGEHRSLAVAVVGTPGGGGEPIAAAPPPEPEPEPEIVEKLEALPAPEVRPGAEAGGMRVRASRRGAERLQERIAPPTPAERPSSSGSSSGS